ncbi:MAG: DHH family phosphoesterase, partial [Puniceicoccales bacterium]|nr:DHH family phosphoesterase [Puniceicoccales bacterium]
MNVMEHFDGAEQFFSVCEQLKGKRVGIWGHLHPDGDCIGAQIVMRDILLQYGAIPLIGLTKGKIAMNSQWIARDYDFTRAEEIAADESIFMDCKIMLRAGDFAKKLSKPLMLINDHIFGEKFARHNFFYPEAAATCEMIADFLEQKQWGIGAATALYVGIVTDTGQFSHSSTVVRTVFLASQLALQGADPHRKFSLHNSAGLICTIF